MTLDAYGVKLRSLTGEDLEMLRGWRNSPDIRQYMEYREEITPEDQQKWFKSIDNDCNYYFIIEYEGQDIGLINLKNYDRESASGEGGLFIYEKRMRGSDIPVRASMCFGDFIWDGLGLEKEYIHILRDNPRSIRYNAFFGFELCPGQENEYNQKYVLTRETHYRTSKKIKILL